MMHIGRGLAQWRRGLGAALIISLTGAAFVGFCSIVAAQGRGAGGGAAAANLDNGKKVFAAQRCEGCHGAQGQGGTGQLAGPQIAPPPTDLAAFTRQVRKPNDQMPPFTEQQVSDADLKDVFAYLTSLKPGSAAAQAPSGNAQNGQRLYVSAGCYECHSREGQGGAGTGPRLAPNPIAFAAFIRQCRQPVSQMPPYTSKVLTDAQLADIYSFLQSVPKPPDVSTIPLLR
jgi:mono/diheme cytochrome c family protein